MNQTERVHIVLRELDKAFPSPEIPLHHKDAYTLLIAVLLSAQCTDIRVNTVTPQLFSLADTPEEMMNQPLERIKEIVRPCGLYERKAQSIISLSKILTEQYGGQVPDNFHALEQLPGVGHKTASVVMNQAFNHPAFPVDTHIFRLARKWKLSKGHNVKKVEEDLKKAFPKSTWGKAHLQIVLYGRTYCKARGCNNTCPICSALFSQ